MHIGCEASNLADHPETHAVAVQFRDLAAQVMAQQSHQVVDFVERRFQFSDENPNSVR